MCPTFTDEIRIVDAIHPLLEKNVRNAIAVPNNVVSVDNFFLLKHQFASLKGIFSLFCFLDCNTRLQFLHYNGTEYGRQNGLLENDCGSANYGSGKCLNSRLTNVIFNGSLQLSWNFMLIFSVGLLRTGQIGRITSD